MYRVGLKLPIIGFNLNRIKKQGVKRLYLASRCYETRSKINCEESHKSRGSTGTVLTLGAVTIGALGILTYAKNNEEFRETLEVWIPGTDRAIQIIFQEESSYFEFILNFFNSLKKKILDMVFGNDPNRPGQVHSTLDCKNDEEYKPPRPAFDASFLNVSPKLTISEKPIPEIRLSKPGEKIKVVSQKPVQGNEEDLVPDLHELEKYAGKLATTAIASFKNAACAVKEYNRNVVTVVESSDSTVGQQIWDNLKNASGTRRKALEEAEKKADEVVKTLKQLQNSIDDPKVEATQGQKIIVRRNIDKILSDVDEAKKAFDEEVANANISEKYWKSVKTARQQFHEELQILFPNVNIDDKKLSITEDAFDLFVLHMYRKITFLQKEIERMQTLADAKLKSALKSQNDQDKIKEAITLEVDKERRVIHENYELRLLEERKEIDSEMRKQLKLQAQVHADHLQELVATKDREADRKVKRALSERKEDETQKHKAELAAVIGRLRGIDEALKNRLNAEKDASDAQLMWGACQALGRAVRAAPPGTKPNKSVRPLEPEINAILKAAPEDDAFVKATIKGIPDEAAKRGVFPEDALRERFIKVEQMARKLALVPEDGASLPVYLLSYLQSFLLIKAVNPIPRHELDDEPIDPDVLDTYDILQRGRYWLDRGDFKMTLRYLNLLKGASRSVAREWMNEARILLETQQAIESLIAFAGANSLVFMGGGEDKNKKKK